MLFSCFGWGAERRLILNLTLLPCRLVYSELNNVRLGPTAFYLLGAFGVETCKPALHSTNTLWNLVWGFSSDLHLVTKFAEWHWKITITQH